MADGEGEAIAQIGAARDAERDQIRPHAGRDGTGAPVAHVGGDGAGRGMGSHLEIGGGLNPSRNGTIYGYQLVKIACPCLYTPLTIAT